MSFLVSRSTHTGEKLAYLDHIRDTLACADLESGDLAVELDGSLVVG